MNEGVEIMGIKIETAQITGAIKKEIKKQREADEYRGFHTEVTSKLETQLRFYECGLFGMVPAEWETIVKPLDPEYAEYMRLKAKFGNSSEGDAK